LTVKPPPLIISTLKFNETGEEMRRLLIIIILLAAGWQGRLLAAVTFFVSPAGDDTQTGSADKPFRTIEKARQAVRSLTEWGNGDDVTVYLHPGTYPLSAPVIFGPQDGGSDSSSVTYRAYDNGEVIISGGKLVNDWQPAADGRWITAVPQKQKVRELFINGKRAQRARHPDKGYLRVAETAPDRMSYFSFHSGDIPETAQPGQTELVFIHDWSISRLPVEKFDFTANRLFPLSKIGRQHPMMVIDGYEPHPRYFLENDPSFCTMAGEWCQRADGRLVYLPLPGEKSDQTQAVIPVLDQLLIIQGDEPEGRFVQNLYFKGLTFEHCRFEIPEEGYAGVQATFHQVDEGGGFEKAWRGIVPAAIQLTLAKNCGFEEVTIRHLGGAGLMFGSRTFNCTLTGSELYDISGNGVMLGESRERTVGEETWWKAAPEQAAAGHVVKDCLIENCGVQFAGAVGIWIGLARRIQISHNELHSLPYTGVSIGWMWNPQPTPCMENMVENNHIHHVMQVLSDGGGIYTLGYQPGSVLCGNLIHDIPLNAGRAESNGMFLDEGTTDILICRNAIYHTARSPLRFHKARLNTVKDNLLAIPAGLPVVRYNRTDEKDILLINNRIINSDAEDETGLDEAVKSWLEKADVDIRE